MATAKVQGLRIIALLASLAAGAEALTLRPAALLRPAEPNGHASVASPWRCGFPALNRLMTYEFRPRGELSVPRPVVSRDSLTIDPC